MNVSGVHYPIDGPRRGPLSAAKRTVRRTLTARWLTPAWDALAAGRVAFLTLHRFAEPERGFFGHDLATMRRGLERLRRERCALMDAGEAVRRLAAGEEFPQRTVVFTMDDGYRGAMDQCADLFQAFDCPLTIFVATGFIDGTHWLWWDQIEYACLASGRPAIDVRWGEREWRIALGDRRSTIVSLLDTCAWCKTLPDDEKTAFIRHLADVAGVALPAAAPAEYAPLTWDELRALERRGFTVGPHTVSHPVLTRTSDAQAAFEIRESWARVRQELAHPVSVFSYPNGSYGARETALVAGLGMAGAVSTREAYATAFADDRGTARFEIPRFGYPEALEPLWQIASGFRGVEQLLGRLRAAR